ncbi:MAG: hypothetical protein WA962_14600 [Ornithinimicrobium sp.]
MEHRVSVRVEGAWSLSTSKTFWEGFAPAALAEHEGESLQTVFISERDWSPVEATITQQDDTAHLTLTGAGDLAAAADQVCRFLAIDIDGRQWPDVAERDPVIAEAQRELPGLRPCGFHSPYEAAAWCVLSQRIRITQAASLRERLISQHGERGAFPSPDVLRSLDLDLPGRKAEYLQAVAVTALDGQLDGARLRSVEPAEAMATVQEVKGLGPFAAELVVIRGANAPDALPSHERRLRDEVAERYGAEARLQDVSASWRPFRTWACVYLRVLRERRTAEMAGGSRS